MFRYNLETALEDSTFGCFILKMPDLINEKQVQLDKLKRTLVIAECCLFKDKQHEGEKQQAVYQTCKQKMPTTNDPGKSTSISI